MMGEMGARLRVGGVALRERCRAHAVPNGKTDAKESFHMDNKKARFIVNTIALVLIIAAAVTSVVMGGCAEQIECVNGSVPMKCHWTFIAVPFVLAPGLGALLCYYGVKDRIGREACSLIAVLAACSATCLIGFGIGTCTGEGMHCRTTGNVVQLLCLLVTTLSLVMSFVDRDRKDKPKRKI